MSGKSWTMSYSAQVGGIDEWEELDNELQCPGRWN